MRKMHTRYITLNSPALKVGLHNSQILHDDHQKPTHRGIINK